MEICSGGAEAKAQSVKCQNFEGFHWPEGFVGLFSQVSFSAITSLVVFGLIGCSFGVREVKDLQILITKKIIRF